MEPMICPVVNSQNRGPEGVFPLDEKNLDSVTDKILATLLESAPVLYKLGGTTVVRLSR
ncbi:uncharacterized protein N7483_001285 [Penicillium malachiteum]|uniref:uncharacterized protein n=1 Tax=Penicillium malachiteum TaxID=1324776 RepID=UPI0025473851|nr:uncharacterized protein N7483_001285 [Penicillium malachiteum]KAJ5736160.1 hypothetical protein N7483_001285 [Penicillium malachiteum]